MERERGAYLFDISQCCERIAKFTEGMSLVQYRSDELVKSAVERSFITIGEALSRLSKTDPDMFASIPDAVRIVSFRTILVHGYESISDELVWEL
jgi:uncharacterized protein with HEPN domain